MAHDHDSTHPHTCGCGAPPADPNAVLCACFGHTRASMEAEWRATGQITAVLAVAEKLRAGECRCAELHPRGVCCLPDLRRTLIEIQQLPARPQADDGCSSCGDDPDCSSCC